MLRARHYERPKRISNLQPFPSFLFNIVCWGKGGCKLSAMMPSNIFRLPSKMHLCTAARNTGECEHANECVRLYNNVAQESWIVMRVRSRDMSAHVQMHVLANFLALLVICICMIVLFSGCILCMGSQGMTSTRVPSVQEELLESVSMCGHAFHFIKTASGGASGPWIASILTNRVEPCTHRPTNCPFLSFFCTNCFFPI